MPPIKLLYIIRDPYPTFRADISILFGKYLPIHGIQSTIVAQSVNNNPNQDHQWRGGDLILGKPVGNNRLKNQILKLLHDIKALILAGKGYSAIQVRNKIITGFIGLLVAKWFKIPFFYWMSYPFPDDDLIRVRDQGLDLGLMRLVFTWIRGHFTKWLLYRVVLPHSYHAFVQSDQMKEDLMKLGIPIAKITAVPMGVDMDLIEDISNLYLKDARLKGRRIIIYIGALDRTRCIDFLFEVLIHVRRKEPKTILLLVGDSNEKADWDWLKKRAKELGITDSVIKTGWVRRELAWQYAKKADVGVCALPSRFIFNSMSPTKAVELLALGVPVVVSEHPDQGKLVIESKGGLCTAYDVQEFSLAILKILQYPQTARKMGLNGQEYIRKKRSYEFLSKKLAKRYHELISSYQ